MARETVLHLLDRVAAIQSQCDLDVLVYLFRHADALLTGEHVAAAVGFELKQVAGSLDSLMFAGLLKRTRSRAEGPGLYVFAVGRPADGPLASLLQIASTRPGRLQILEALATQVSRRGREPSANLHSDDVPMRDRRKGIEPNDDRNRSR
jgi:hypothetical protein